MMVSFKVSAKLRFFFVFPSLFVINDVREAFKIIDGIDSNDIKYILLENDLPDIFNEK